VGLAPTGKRRLVTAHAEPDHFPACPLPTHDLRNGRLNQAAYSLFLFMRDVANGDLSAGSTGGSPMPTLLRCPIERHR
jgi:hypothetical protein